MGAAWLLPPTHSDPDWVPSLDSPSNHKTQCAAALFEASSFLVSSGAARISFELCMQQEDRLDVVNCVNFGSLRVRKWRPKSRLLTKHIRKSFHATAYEDARLSSAYFIV